MTRATNLVKKETMITAVCIAFLFGFIGGIGFAVYKMSPQAATSSVATEDGDPHIHMTEQQAQAIKNLEAEVAASPEDYRAWIQLGHLYFDTNQPPKAVEAYSRSLELHPGSSDLWTDLGVMYRRSGQPEKAIAAFDKAHQMDSSHEPSLLNKGIVLLYDLQDMQGAAAAWETLTQINPQAKTASGDLVSDFVEQLKSAAATQQTN